MSDPHVPASAPGDDEPKTPMWLPALGAALFIALGLWWAVTPSAPSAAAAAAASASAAAAPPPPATIAAAAQPPARPAAPSPNGAPDLQRQLEQLRRNLGTQHPGGH